jgi:Tfp pilus assembly protein PilO
MSEFAPTVEFFKEEIKKYDNDIRDNSDRWNQLQIDFENEEITKEAKDKIDQELREKEYELKHQLLDMVKQLPEAEKEITARIEEEIQNGIAEAEDLNEMEAMMAEEEGREPQAFFASLNQALIDSFGYELEEMPKSDIVEKAVNSLKEKYKDSLGDI